MVSNYVYFTRNEGYVVLNDYSRFGRCVDCDDDIFCFDDYDFNDDDSD